MRVEWAPSSREEEIRKCVSTLLATTPGTVPYARALGLEELVDVPQPAVVQRLKVSAVRAVRTYEPRAVVRSVTVAGDADGRLVPTVVIEEVRS